MPTNSNADMNDERGPDSAALPFRPRAVRQFHGHHGDIFDLSWSSSSFLLSSGRDKTVRLWHAHSNGALKMFRCASSVRLVQPKRARTLVIESIPCFSLSLEESI